jgi:hypothetical protein
VNTETHVEEVLQMYDMYPEWGPGRHRFDDATGPLADETASGLRAGVQAGLDLRDNGGQRPDDN